MKKYLLLTVVALAAVGCVGKSKYNALNKDLQSCQQTLAASDTAKKGLEQALTMTKAEREALAAERQNLVQEKTKLEGKTKEYEDMVGSLQQELNAGNVKISQMKDRLTVNLVDKVLFDSGSAEIRKEGQEALAKVADVLKNYPEKGILVEGHTDNVPVRGTLKSRYPSNWELSAARATTVARFLSEKGVTPARVSAVGFGEYRPVAANDTADGKKQNRRIEISMLKASLEKVPMAPVAPAAPVTPAKP
jgi:chemotaxis protein MotB